MGGVEVIYGDEEDRSGEEGVRSLIGVKLY